MISDVGGRGCRIWWRKWWRRRPAFSRRVLLVPTYLYIIMIYINLNVYARLCLPIDIITVIIIKIIYIFIIRPRECEISNKSFSFDVISAARPICVFFITLETYNDYMYPSFCIFSPISSYRLRRKYRVFHVHGPPYSILLNCSHHIGA